MQGRCLCERVSFEIIGEMPRLYQCRCTLCRRQSGSASSTGTIVSKDNFRWLSGQELVGSWIKKTGFRSDFCKNCGAPLPNPLRDMPYVWIPVGLLEGNEELQIGMHVWTDSRAPWDKAALTGVVHDTAPSLDRFIENLHETSNPA